MRRSVLLLLLAGVLGPLVWAASAQVPIGTANFIEWDIPATAGQPPAALEILPTTGGGRAVLYVTEGSTQPPRLVRFTPGSPIATGAANWLSWNYGGVLAPIARTGGLKARDAIVFIRDSLAVTRINTNANTRVRYTDGLGSRSDLAEDNNFAYTTGPAAGGGTLQRLFAGTSVGTLTRWTVGGGAGSVYLSGVAVGPGAPGQRLVYYSEPTSNQIGQLTPLTNNVRRWLLPPGVTQPRQLDVDAQGKVWVVTGSGHVVRLDPATNMVTPYLIPTPGSNPMGIGPDGQIGFTETGTNKVGMLIPDGAQIFVAPTNQTVTPTSSTVPGVSATIPPQGGTAAPVTKTGPATSTGTAATGIFVEASLPVTPGTPSMTPLAIEDDTVQPSAPPNAFARAFFYSLGNPTTNRIGRVELVRPAPEPTVLTLAPPTATNTVGTQHCVTATVRDQFGEPVPNVTVRFSVTGVNSPSGSASVTNASGQATFCYTGTAAGPDTINAYADSDGDSTQDPGEPTGLATKVWTPGAPATLTLEPTAPPPNTVGTQHCVTATVRDAFGNPVPNVTVHFSVPTAVATHATPASGSATTNQSGQAQFCYSASLPGEDVIHAFADTNGDGDQDAGEPFGDATKTWILPLSTAFCEVKITQGGWIIANNGDRASFGGNAKVTGDGETVQGQEQYHDHGPLTPMNVHSIELLATTCDDDLTTATIFGTATIDGSGEYVFRIDVTDMGEPGRSDTYGIMLDNGYVSGQHLLQGGDVQIHKN